jgi:FKBP-type peptidyl-prolyl cis-trans isomerase
MEKKKKKKLLIAAIVFLGLIALFTVPPFGRSQPSREPSSPSPFSEPQSGLEIEDLVVGGGATAEVGDTVSVHYTGTLRDGTKFDSSYDRGEPFSFTIGKGSVIAGWEKGIVGMKVGGKRKLTIPPELGYGEKDMGKIPPNSTLIFEIELLDVQKP